MIKSLRSYLDLLLFRGRGVLPTKGLLVLYASLSIVLVGFSFLKLSWTFILMTNILFFSLSFLDLFLSPGRKELSFKRRIPIKLERDLIYDIKIDVKNKSDKSFQFIVRDDLPQSFIKKTSIKGEVGAKEEKTFSYQLSAAIRGDYRLAQLHIRYKSPLGLWAKQMTVEDESRVKVIPDMTEVKDYLEDAQSFLMYEGMKIKRQQVGTGEFASIRNYVVGDDPRRINWHQTAKLQEVMTNIYEPEQGKYITILIDCGRMMGVELKDANRLERVLESALTLAAAALDRGDYVAVLAFSNEIKSYIPPEKGIDHIQTIVNELYKLEVEAVESNYQLAFHYTETALNKRSLLFLFSDVQTFLQNDLLLNQLIRIRERHLFFMVGLEDYVIKERAALRPETVEESMIKSIAQDQLLRKREEKLIWEGRGLQLIEAEEEHLTATAVSYYIELMNEGLL